MSATVRFSKGACCSDPLAVKNSEGACVALLCAAVLFSEVQYGYCFLVTLKIMVVALMRWAAEFFVAL